MAIRHLQVQHFRNIQQSAVSPSEGFNYIFGINGSGKTSLLEAIYCLSRARSFRTHQTNQLITKGEDHFSVIGKVSQQGRDSTIGIQRRRGNSEIRLAGKPVSKAGDLAAVLPISVLDTSLNTLIEAGPEGRRKFLDWGVFHVEPSFRTTWHRFKRALSQRNAALRAGWSKKAIEQWNQELSLPAMELDRLRRDYLSELTGLVKQTNAGFNGLENIDLAYYQGWSEDSDYMEYLNKHFKSDNERGYTQFGPHRGDLRIQTAKGHAKEILSRGQQKLCVASLVLAQCQQISSLGKQTIILVDDLAAELDEDNRKALLSALRETGSQVFITGTDDFLYQDVFSDAKVFHVEQGLVKPV